MEELAEKISNSELEIMNVLWDAGRPLSVTEIRQALQKRLSWEATTVKTMVSRLHAKGVLAQTKKDVFYYSPCISRDFYNRHATEGIIDRLYHGSVRNLVAALVQSNGLSEEDLEELRAMFRVEGSHE